MVLSVDGDSVASSGGWSTQWSSLLFARRRHRSLKLPDALVFATAEHSSADRLITTDRKWPTAKVMKLTVSIEQI